MGSVPKLWAVSDLAVLIGSGPSLTEDDVAACRGRRVVAISDAIRLAPFADVLYSSDQRWWNFYDGWPSFTGLKVGMATPEHKKKPGRADVLWLRNTGYTGLEGDPGGLRTGLAGGANSGFQAVNLAVHLGAKRILLLGYDMKPDAHGKTHFFGKHPSGLHVSSPYGMFARSFDSLVEPLQKLGIQVWNCSRDTAVTAFSRMPLAEALAMEAVAA